MRPRSPRSPAQSCEEPRATLSPHARLFIYALTFFVAVTIDWMIPRFMPGDPITQHASPDRAWHPAAEASQAM